MKPKTIAKCSVLILGVIIIPLLYSFFYLQAFWDPYNSLKTVPVAIVNSDKGAVINGEQRNLGKEATDKLLDDETLNFEVTNSSDAQDGAAGTKYYAVITFPSNFSECIASASTSDKQVAEISYESNQKRNYIASQIMKNAVTKLEETARGSVDKEITSTLTAKLKEIPSKLGTLNDGLTQLNDGATALSSGAKQAANGQNALSNGIKSLSSGVVSLNSGASSLNSGLGALDSGLGEASDGAKQLSLAVSTNMPMLKTGITSLNSGAQSLLLQFSPGGDAKNPTVYDGVTSVTKGTQTYVSAVNNTLYTMIKTDPASAQLLAGYKTSLTTAQAAYVTATDPNLKAQYAQQVQMLANLVTIYSAATNPSVTSESAFETALVSMASSDATKQSVVSSGETLAAGSGQLQSQFENGGAFKTGVSQLAGGTAILAKSTDSLGQLSDGINQLSSALSALKDGSSKALSGSQQLASGLASAKSGSEVLLSGSNKLAQANSEINDGAQKLSSGTKTAKNSVSTSINDANSELKSTDGLDTYAENPVKIKEDSLNPIPNYGTAFAPYFMSLSLWVGAILMFFGIYLDADERIKVLSRHSNKKVVRVCAFALIGVAQAIALGMIVQLGLGFSVDNVPAYYASCILISLVFISIVEFLIVNLKDLGKFLSIAFLVLQLTSCGGTFPMETVPKFFNVLYPYMPMTYSVNLLKELSSSYNSAAAWHNIFVLIGICVVFTSLTLLFSISRKAKIKVREMMEAQN